MYKLFIRNWWRKSANGVMVPDPGARKTTMGFVHTQEDAKARCKEYNESHDPGPLSRKMEYTKD